MSYCLYYQARIEEKECWFLVAILRSFEHLTFDRTVDKEASIFEFFVPVDNERIFLELMQFLKEKGVVKEVHKLPNRLLNPEEIV